MSQQITFETELRTLLKTGKVILGSRKTIKALKSGKLKAIVIASTLRTDIRSDIIHYAKLSGIPVYEYQGSGWNLGTLTAKPFMVSTIGVEELGDSKIMEVGKSIT
ncbi:50S ribosomal protein L30e [Candidatus Acidianus copahuensis]|uniref:Large ribosomal subunit protein eL30 n=1 Tax=Candidatus Acidianus copahuensis TaxID=1160895 RepID=A0A031LLK4_9CREN|nr:50S ribosomal protein L30e [Candidatus Acidianus copahuensis]EZQ03087.1 50S ribosomal protein L30 [Candidatus Acidianus copahuensis]NON62939.1 50S ribosomal protein L30e [Acidianus sp. RZ1]